MAEEKRKKKKEKKFVRSTKKRSYTDAFRTSPFIVAIKEFEETLNDKGAPIDEDRRTKGK